MDKNTDIRLEQTIVDKNFKEIKQHGTDGFPFVVYKDDFFRFEYGLILWHWHEEVQFTLVAEGEVHMLIGDKELVLSEGEGIFINSKVLHQLQPQLKNKGCVISFIWKTSLLENDVLSDVYLNCILPVLKGEDYATPVKYWMPFNGGIGLHDADWRSKFGGTIYQTNGSHGCINLPPKVAAQVYENAYKGIPIICCN